MAANENGENRTVLLLGDLAARTNPPVSRLWGFIYITLSRIRLFQVNLNGITTTNVIPLADGPSLFFAQRIDGNL